MSVTSVEKDFDRLTLTLTADFAAPVEQVWQLWADPRQLERWWGPPTYPATMEKHDLSPGGLVSYYMTGPEGDQHHGWWEVTAANPPRSLEFAEGFAEADGTRSASMPTTTMRMTLTEHNGGTRMLLHTAYPSRAEMDKLIEMGMAEGLAQAVGQMDALLAG